MLAGADTGIRHRQLAGLLLRRRQHLGQRRVGQVLASDQHVGNAEHQRDRRELLHRVVAELRIERRVEHDVAQAADQKGVAVGGFAGDELGADHGAGAGLVLDHHALAEPLSERVRDGAPDDIVGTAGPDRHDDSDRLVGIALREGGVGGESAVEHGGIGEGAASLHRSPPVKRFLLGRFVGPTIAALSGRVQRRVPRMRG